MQKDVEGGQFLKNWRVEALYFINLVWFRHILMSEVARFQSGKQTSSQEPAARIPAGSRSVCSVTLLSLPFYP